ncbi:hypothetical protein [Streptomyces flavofungini]|uniref:hypothetical protein n=1 Tax=Streptomyces flavofungini TaxID=68200 RepID=UPI0034DE00CC
MTAAVSPPPATSTDRARQDSDISLRRALGPGAWGEASGHLRGRPAYDGPLILLRSSP